MKKEDINDRFGGIKKETNLCFGHFYDPKQAKVLIYDSKAFTNSIATLLAIQTMCQTENRALIQLRVLENIFFYFLRHALFSCAL